MTFVELEELGQHMVLGVEKRGIIQIYSNNRGRENPFKVSQKRAMKESYSQGNYLKKLTISRTGGPTNDL